MKIQLYIDDVVKEECVEEGFVVFCGNEKIRVLNLFSNEGKHELPYVEKNYLFPNGALYTVRLSTAPAFDDICNSMRQFRGSKFIELCDGNAKLQIDY